jgi:hypothetical protein
VVAAHHEHDKGVRVGGARVRKQRHAGLSLVTGKAGRPTGAAATSVRSETDSQHPGPAAHVVGSVVPSDPHLGSVLRTAAILPVGRSGSGCRRLGSADHRARSVPWDSVTGASGDWHDVLALPTGDLAMVVGDAAGRGSVGGGVERRVAKVAGHDPANRAEPAQSSAEVIIVAASIDTGDEQRDAHLRSPESSRRTRCSSPQADSQPASTLQPAASASNPAPITLRLRPYVEQHRTQTKCHGQQHPPPPVVLIRGGALRRNPRKLICLKSRTT